MIRRIALALLAACCAAAGPAAARPQIAITFDDLPSHGPLPPGATRRQVGQDIIAALGAAHVRDVFGFVNGVWLDREPATRAVLDDWHAAGFPLGNHGWSHLALSKVGADTTVAEIERNVPLLAQWGVPVQGRWYRFPFLDEGADPAARAAIRAALARSGTRIAAVTMSFGDYLWNDAYARCAAARDEAAITRLEQTYLAAAHEAARASRAEARAVYGRDIPYVLLMHLGAFDARMLPRLLAQYRREGFGFVSLPQAERDPAYAADTDPRLPPRPSLDAQARATGTPLPPATDYATLLAGLCVTPAAAAAGGGL